jgi:hypothetical protein
MTIRDYQSGRCDRCGQTRTGYLYSERKEDKFLCHEHFFSRLNNYLLAILITGKELAVSPIPSSPPLPPQLSRTHPHLCNSVSQAYVHSNVRANERQ